MNTKFKEGKKYKLTHESTWAVFHTNDYGLEIGENKYFRLSDLFTYNQGKLMTSDGVSYIKNADDYFHDFERYYYPDQIQHFEKLREQYAGQAMQAILCNEDMIDRAFDMYKSQTPMLTYQVAKMAHACAVALVNIIMDEL